MTQYIMNQEKVTIITARYPTSSHGLLLVVVFHFVVGWLTLVVFESAFVVSEKYNQQFAAICVHFWGLNIFKVVKLMTAKRDMLPGQFCKLQDSLSVLSPSHRPPFFSSTFFVLVFVLVPAPQVLEQSLICHSFHSQLTRVSMV